MNIKRQKTVENILNGFGKGTFYIKKCFICFQNTQIL